MFRFNPDLSLRAAERQYLQEPTWQNFVVLQKLRIRAGLQQHIHDCDQCILLETSPQEGLDFYYCPKGSFTVRYSAQGPDYESYPMNRGTISLFEEGLLSPLLMHTIRLAQERGFVSLYEC